MNPRDFRASSNYGEEKRKLTKMEEEMHELRSVIEELSVLNFKQEKRYQEIRDNLELEIEDLKKEMKEYIEKL